MRSWEIGSYVLLVSTMWHKAASHLTRGEHRMHGNQSMANIVGDTHCLQFYCPIPHSNTPLLHTGRTENTTAGESKSIVLRIETENISFDPSSNNTFFNWHAKKFSRKCLINVHPQEWNPHTSSKGQTVRDFVLLARR